MTNQEQDRLVKEYERIEDLHEAARRRCDFKLAEKYQAMLEKLEAQLWPWMAQK